MGVFRGGGICGGVGMFIGGDGGAVRECLGGAVWECFVANMVLAVELRICLSCCSEFEGAQPLWAHA